VPPGSQPGAIPRPGTAPQPGLRPGMAPQGIQPGLQPGMAPQGIRHVDLRAAAYQAQMLQRLVPQTGLTAQGQAAILAMRAQAPMMQLVGQPAEAQRVGAGLPSCGGHSTGAVQDASAEDPSAKDLRDTIRRLQDSVAADQLAATSVSQMATPSAEAERPVVAAVDAAAEPLGSRDEEPAEPAGRGGRGRRGGRGEAGIEGRTIFVSNIPAALCAIAKLDGHFSRFGRVVNIKVVAESHHALIEYSNRIEAVAALDSPDTVLDEPAILLTWANQRSGARGASSGGRAAGGGRAGGGRAAPLQRNSVKREPPSSEPLVTRKVVAPASTVAPKPAAARQQKQAQLDRQKILDAKLVEQKACLEKLQSTKMPKAARTELMNQLKSLSESVKELLNAHPAANKSSKLKQVGQPVSAVQAPATAASAEAEAGAPAAKAYDAGSAAVAASAEAEAGTPAAKADGAGAAAVAASSEAARASDSDPGQPIDSTSCEGALCAAESSAASIDLGPEEGQLNQYTDTELTNYEDQ